MGGNLKYDYCELKEKPQIAPITRIKTFYDYCELFLATEHTEDTEVSASIITSLSAHELHELTQIKHSRLLRTFFATDYTDKQKFRFAIYTWLWYIKTHGLCFKRKNRQTGTVYR